MNLHPRINGSGLRGIGIQKPGADHILEFHTYWEGHTNQLSPHRKLILVYFAKLPIITIIIGLAIYTPEYRGQIARVKGHIQ